MFMIQIFLMFLGFFFLVLATFGIQAHPRFNFEPAGLALWLLALIIGSLVGIHVIMGR